MSEEKRKFLVDGHVHTMECGHAYNTITEMAKGAKDNGIELMCWTEHGPDLGPKLYRPDGKRDRSRDLFFKNMRVIPPEIEGVRVLKGIEADILNQNGDLDVRPGFKDSMEVISASLHFGAYKGKRSKEDFTDAVIAALNNPDVDYVCHLGNPSFPIDQEAVIKEAAKNDKLIEINNASFYVRTGSRDNCIKIAELCKKYNVPVILGSDAHWSSHVGQFPNAEKVLDLVNMPEELIINTDPQKLLKYLEAHGKNLGQYRPNEAIGLFDDLEEYPTVE